MTCVVCGGEVNKKPGRGRKPRFCSDGCKKEHNKLRARENRRNGKWKEQVKGRKFYRAGDVCETHNRPLVRRGKRGWCCPDCENEKRREKWKNNPEWREKEKCRMARVRKTEEFRIWSRKYDIGKSTASLQRSDRMKRIYRKYFFVLNIRYGLHKMPFAGFVERYKIDSAFRQRVREYQKEYYALRKATDPEYAAKERVRHRRKARRVRYGLSVDDVGGMLVKQNHGCGICQSPIDDETCHVDHCHDTGNVRGLLCRFCNLLLGRTLDWGGWDSWVERAGEYRQNPPYSPANVVETPISPQFSTN